MDTTLKRDIRLVNIAGIMGSLYGCLVSGEILLFFITQCLKIPKETWALAASFIPITSALHLVSAYLTERLRRRKVLSLTCFAVARLATPAITLLPFITGETEIRFRLYYLATALIAQAGIDALGVSSWLSWVADIVPEEQRGRFYSVRFALTTTAGVVGFLGAGRLLDAFGRETPWGYVVTFGFAFLIGELDLVIHSGVPDRPMVVPEERIRLTRLLAAPWRHRGFRNLILMRSLLAFADGICFPLVFMYLVDDLGLGPTQTGILAAVFMVAQALAFPMWRVVGDRVGYRTVYLITCTLSGVGILYWWFLPQNNFAFFFTMLVLARVYFGALNAGTLLAEMTLTMNTAPEKHRSMYFAQVSTLISAAAAVGIFCGRWVFLSTDPPAGVYFLGTRLTGAHILVGLFGIIRLAAAQLVLRRVPDARAEAVLPQISRLFRTNPIRVFSVLLPLERPISEETRAKHIDYMTRLVPAHQQVELAAAVRTVLKDRVREEEELYGIIGRERVTRGKGMERMTDEIAGLAATRLRPAWAKAATARILRLYNEGDLAGCVRTAQHLAHRVAESHCSDLANSALAVIDALADSADVRGALREEAVLLAVYACVQMLREPKGDERQ